MEYDEGSVIEDEEDMSDVEDIMNAVFGEEGGIYEDSSRERGDTWTRTLMKSTVNGIIRRTH